jgi:acid stress-induced BolA-like protein IbaG/YrbA
MTSQDIETLVRSGFPEAVVQVVDQVGDGNHFQAVVITPAFTGKSLVERHQLVYGSLKGAMADRIHALSIKAYTPDEWAQAQARRPD